VLRWEICLKGWVEFVYKWQVGSKMAVVIMVQDESKKVQKTERWLM